MPWCPKCKNEYVEGITVCADCGCELVETEEELQETSTAFSGDAFADGAENAENVEDAGAGDEWVSQEMEAADAAPPEDMANAVHLGRSLRQAQDGGVYEDSAQKAEEFKSGAYTLLFVGILGFVVLGLLLSGLLPIRLNPASQWMTCLVMGALFLIFIVMGVLSLQSAGKLAVKAGKEASLKEDMEVFCREKMNAGELDASCGVSEEDSTELRYFKRTEALRQILTEQFPEAESGYLDNFVDEVYPELFGE